MKKGLLLGGVVAILIGLYGYFMLPTKIGFVNFRDDQMAEITKANDNWFIQPIQVKLEESDFSEIVDAPAIYMSHLSTLSEVQRANLQKAIKNGAKVHVLMATSKENDLSNVSGEDLDYIKACFNNSAEENTKRWLNYSRKVFDNRSLFVDEITPAVTFPSDVFYRIGTQYYFESLEDYWADYKTKGLYKAGAQTVAIININVNPQTVFRSYQDSLILNMEARGYNVACISGFGKRFKNLKKLSPDLVMYFPHGRLNMMNGDVTVEWLKIRNIPVLIPQLVHQTYEQWIADQQGMAGGIFGQNVVVPELDGGILPYAVAAQYMNKQGYHTFKPIPGRIDRFCENADKWLALKNKSNSEKKLTIFYYKGPGKNALTAGDMEVGPSIFNVLNSLKSKGYDLGDLPAEYEAFITKLKKDGPLLGTYAKGTYQEWLKVAHPAMVSMQEYEKWAKSQLPKEAYEAVLSQFGAPGSQGYLTTTVNDTLYFTIPKVQFGNISLLPVLAPSAQDENQFKAVHGTDKAPPHTYIASYLWPRMNGVDAILHFGTHGSIEFTPSKQVLLSSRDWPDALIAPLPHLYIYTIDNIGEAMMAKRRSYGTLLSHLTPPLSEAELYDEFEDISRILKNYGSTADGQLKDELRNKIRAFADSLDLDKDLGFTQEKIEAMEDATIDNLDNYVNHLAKEKITIGLHIYGQSYTDAEIRDMVKMMAVNPISHSLFEIALMDGKADKKKGAIVFSDQATEMVTQILDGKAAPEDLISERNQQLMEELLAEYGKPGETAISEYYGGNYAKNKKAKKASTSKEEMVYDMKTHKMVPKSSLEGKSTHGSHGHGESQEEMVYDHKTHKMVPKSSLEGESTHGDHSHGESKKEMVYDHKTHKMVPKSSLKGTSAHGSHGHGESQEEMVYDHKTHKMVPKSSLEEKQAHGSHGHGESKEEMVYDMKTHKMVPKSSLGNKDISSETAQGLALHLSADRKTAQGIVWIKDDKEFKNISSLLDPAQLHKFTNTAAMDASVAEKVAIMKDDNYKKLLNYVQDDAKRQALIAWINLDETQQRIAGYRAKLDAMVLAEAMKNATTFLSVYKTPIENYQVQLQNQGREEIKVVKKTMLFFQENKGAIVDAEENGADLIAIQAILNSESAKKGLEDKMALIETRRKEIEASEKQILASLVQLVDALNSVKDYEVNLKASPEMELEAVSNGMIGGYIAPSSGGDPVSNPLSVPTGKNLYAVNAEVTPTKEAYELGVKMGDQILQKHIAKHGDYPKKMAFSLWSAEFIRNKGLNIGQILYMLGVEPVRNARGRVHDVKLIPSETLGRPRIDVVVQTSGQFRDLAASRIYLINKAIALASNAPDKEKYPNYVKDGTEQAERELKAKGLSAEEARKFSTVRVFGEANGGYGTGIMDLVESGDQWETEDEIADVYLNNMGAMYAEGSWAQYREGMFETMLQNTEVVVHPRSSNITGPISLDHVYEYMGGITASIRVTTGKDPDGYFNDYRNKFDPRAQGLKEAIWTETRTNLFNPKYIKGQMAEGESAAEAFAESFRDTYGWNVMKPDVIDKEIWEGYYDIYVKDKKNLGTKEFFEEKNPYALQEMTAVMLETIRKGYWKPSEEVIKDIAKTHGELVKNHEAGCSGFVCDNAKLKEMISGLLDGDLKQSYNQEIAQVREGPAGEQPTDNSIVLKKQEQKSLSEIIQDNQKAVISLIIAIVLMGGAIGYGILKRRRSER